MVVVGGGGGESESESEDGVGAVVGVGGGGVVVVGGGVVGVGVVGGEVAGNRISSSLHQWLRPLAAEYDVGRPRQRHWRLRLSRQRLAVSVAPVA